MTSFGELVMAEGDTAAAARAGNGPLVEARAQAEMDLADAYVAGQPHGEAYLDSRAAAWAAAYEASHPTPPTWQPEAQPAAEAESEPEAG
jgi:hypothetical protein